jgi:hypothetical protein
LWVAVPDVRTDCRHEFAFGFSLTISAASRAA